MQQEGCSKARNFGETDERVKGTLGLQCMDWGGVGACERVVSGLRVRMERL